MGTMQQVEVAADALHVALFPNPARTYLMVDVRSGFTGRINVSITDATGRRVRELLVDKASNLHRMRLDVSELASGTYQLQVIEEDRQVIEQFVKLR